jgi:hypothetical protein
MEGKMDIVTAITVGIVGLGGVFALSVVPWVCIGTGLKNPDKDYT